MVRYCTAMNSTKSFVEPWRKIWFLKALIPQLDGVPYYWTSGNQAEIEFLIEHIDQVIPVEVKSATRISGGSLASYTSRYNPSLRVRLSMNNLQYNGGLISIPLPLADWILRLIAMAYYFSP